MIRRTPRSTLLPYTTLFRSWAVRPRLHLPPAVRPPEESELPRRAGSSLGLWLGWVERGDVREGSAARGPSRPRPLRRSSRLSGRTSHGLRPLSSLGRAAGPSGACRKERGCLQREIGRAHV